MAENTLTRADIVDRMHADVGLSRAESGRMVDRMLGLIRDELSEGDDVKLSGFGSFIVRQKGERMGRNPRTRQEVPIAPRRVVTFRASSTLRERVAGAE